MARRHADLVIAPSSLTRMELIREGFTPEDVYIARLGVDAEPFRLEPTADEVHEAPRVHEIGVGVIGLDETIGDEVVHRIRAIAGRARDSGGR